MKKYRLPIILLVIFEAVAIMGALIASDHTIRHHSILGVVSYFLPLH